MTLIKNLDVREINTALLSLLNDIKNGGKTTNTNNQILNTSDDDIIVYDTVADLEQDLPNLNEGDIVATEDYKPFNVVDEVTSGVMSPVTSNAVANNQTNTLSSTDETPITSKGVYDALQGLIKTKDITIQFNSVSWVTYASGGYYVNLPVSNYITNVTKLISIVTVYWTQVNCSGFYLGFDSSGASITVMSQSNMSSGYVTARIVYI